MSRLRPIDRVLLVVLGSIWLVGFSLHVLGGLSGRLAEPDVYVFAPADPQGYPTVRSIRVGTRAVASGLEPGDELRRIGASDLRGMGSIRFFAHAMQAMGPDRRATVTYRRGDSILETSLEYTPYPLPIRFVAVSAGFVLAGLLVILRAPRNPKAIALYRASLVFSLGFLRPWGGPVVQTYGWLIAAVVLTPLFAPLCVLAARSFRPRPPQGWIAKAWPWTFLLVGPIFYSGIVGIPLFDERTNYAAAISMLLLDLVGIGMIVELTISYRQSDPIGRRQIKWIVCGIYVSVVPDIIATIVSLSDAKLWWVSDASEISFVLIPIAIIVAIVRYNMFDIDRIISATASYSLLILVAVPAVILLLPTTADALSGAVGIDPWSGRLLLSVGIAAVSVPAYRTLNPVIDGYFFPERHAFEEQVVELLEDLSRAESPTDLAMRSSSRIDELLRPESLASYVRTSGGYASIFARGRAVPPFFEEGNPIISVLRVRRKPIASGRWARDRADRDLSGFDRAALESMDAAVLIPVRRRGELLAFSCLGPKRSGDVYTATELALLGAVGDKVAAELARFDEAEIARQSEEMQQALRRYVPGAVAAQLDSRDEIRPEERDVSVLFVDIRGFSSYAEKLRAEEIFSTVNRYTELVSDIVHRHAGSVVEFNGDGMMAVFGAPRELAAKERSAIEAGRAIVAAVGSIELGEAPEPARLSVGVGVATGRAFVGNIRAVDRMIWSAIGNTTNRAARLEALTRTLGVAMVIDPATREAAGPAGAGFEIREGVPLRGYREPTDVYVLVTRPS